MAYYSLDILTPSKVLTRDIEADSLLIPTVKGEINVLPDHTHIVSKLDTGIITVQAKGEKADHYFVSTGLCKVLGNKVTVLAETAEHRDEIDPDRAKKALDKAISQLNGEDSLAEEMHRKYVKKVERAQARLKAAYLK